MRNTLRLFEGEYEAHVAGHRCDALRCAGMTRFRVVDQSDPNLPAARDICPTGAIQGEPGAFEVDDTLCIRCGACTDLAPRGLVREAAPPGTAAPPQRVPKPSGVAAAAGRVPLPFQATVIARPEGGMGGPTPFRR